MPTENRSSNTEQMVSLPMSTLKKCLRDARLVRFTCDKHVLHLQDLLAQPAVQHQVEPEASIPDGYCLMPRRLTAENGAKALLLGEFKLQVTRECPECQELEEPSEGCEVCDGEGEHAQRHTIPWDQIKFIYSTALAGLVLKAESATSR